MNSEWLDRKANELATDTIPAEAIRAAAHSVEKRMRWASTHWNPLHPDSIPHIAFAALEGANHVEDVAGLEGRFSCTGGCVPPDVVGVDCPRHGDSPTTLWARIDELEALLIDYDQTVQQIRTICTEHNNPARHLSPVAAMHRVDVVLARLGEPRRDGAVQ